jgi:hypothetical protein
MKQLSDFIDSLDFREYRIDVGGSSEWDVSYTLLFSTSFRSIIYLGGLLLLLRGSQNRMDLRHLYRSSVMVLVCPRWKRFSCWR